ncbi:hypothetical protein ACVIGB_000945 [Bradyrhizobium sp. USDA 4341]
MLDPTELNRLNLMRLTEGERQRVSAALASAASMEQLVAYIRAHLSWYPFVSPDLAQSLFDFGRDMRVVVDGGVNRGLKFPLYGDELPVRTYLLFLAGFLGCSREFADQIRRQPLDLLSALTSRFSFERAHMHSATLEAAE